MQELGSVPCSLPPLSLAKGISASTRVSTLAGTDRVSNAGQFDIKLNGLCFKSHGNCVSVR